VHCCPPSRLHISRRPTLYAVHGHLFLFSCLFPQLHTSSHCFYPEVLPQQNANQPVYPCGFNESRSSRVAPTARRALLTTTRVYIFPSPLHLHQARTCLFLLGRLSRYYSAAALVRESLTSPFSLSPHDYKIFPSSHLTLRTRATLPKWCILSTTGGLRGSLASPLARPCLAPRSKSPSTNLSNLAVVACPMEFLRLFRLTASSLVVSAL